MRDLKGLSLCNLAFRAKRQKDIDWKKLISGCSWWKETSWQQSLVQAQEHQVCQWMAGWEFARKPIHGPEQLDSKKYCFVLKSACETKTGCCFHGFASDWFCFHLQGSIGITCIDICLWVQVSNHMNHSCHSYYWNIQQESLRNCFALWGSNKGTGRRVR